MNSNCAVAGMSEISSQGSSVGLDNCRRILRIAPRLSIVPWTSPEASSTKTVSVRHISARGRAIHRIKESAAAAISNITQIFVFFFISTLLDIDPQYSGIRLRILERKIPVFRQEGKQRLFFVVGFPLDTDPAVTGLQNGQPLLGTEEFDGIG